MKRVTYIIIALTIYNTALFSQNERLKRGSLPIFNVVDKEISTFIDSFIVETQKYSALHPLAAMHFSISLDENNNLFALSLALRKAETTSDSIVLYKHPSCKQILVSHGNHLVLTRVCKYHRLTKRFTVPDALLKKTRTKGAVFYKKTPKDYYLNHKVRGELAYEDEIFIWGYEFQNGSLYQMMQIIH